MLRKFSFVPGEFYHLYNRGNSKQNIFLDDFDYQRFQRLLYLCNTFQNFKIDHIRDSRVDFYDFQRKGSLVAIGAYCLMPNHFHILLTPLVEDGVSIFMKKLGTGYSMYFNKRYERTGSLFEGRFKAQITENENHLKYLFAYIYLNPLKIIDPLWKENGTEHDLQHKKYLEAYKFSSFGDHLGDKRKENKILNRSKFPAYFEDSKRLRDDVFGWLTDRTDLSVEVAE